MTPVGKTVELECYRIPDGERALKARLIEGRTAVIDVPVDHEGRVYLVERHVESQSELDGLVAEYVQRSAACGEPAILAILRSAQELADALA
jgi:hypothetical protein